MLPRSVILAAGVTTGTSWNAVDPTGCMELALLMMRGIGQVGRATMTSERPSYQQVRKILSFSTAVQAAAAAPICDFGSDGQVRRPQCDLVRHPLGAIAPGKVEAIPMLAGSLAYRIRPWADQVRATSGSWVLSKGTAGTGMSSLAARQLLEPVTRWQIV